MVFQLHPSQQSHIHFSFPANENNLDLFQPYSMIRMKPEIAFGEGAGTDNSLLEMKLERPPQSQFHHHIFPKIGEWYHLSSPYKAGRHMRSVAEIWVCQVLALGYPVHWIDGACRMDPSRLLKLLRQMNEPVEECLSRLYVSRGFTLHQLVRQIERLPDEIKLTGSPFVFIDGLLMMHTDDQVGHREARMLLQHECHILNALQIIHPLMIVSTGDSNIRTRRESILSEILKANVQCQLHGNIIEKKGIQRLFLRHEPSSQAGFWIDEKPPLTLNDFISIGMDKIA